MRIIHCNKKSNIKKIEKECGFVYFNDGVKIANLLYNICLFPKNSNCIGLAHNQIGGNKKVFVVKLNDTWKNPSKCFFVNAEIVETSDTYNMCGEGCMSFPNKYNEVKRYDWIVLRYQVQARSNPKGEAFINKKFEGMNAQIIQHEIAHLEGKHIFSNCGKSRLDQK